MTTPSATPNQVEQPINIEQAYDIANRFCGDCRGYLDGTEQLLVCRELMRLSALQRQREQPVGEVAELLVDLADRPDKTIGGAESIYSRCRKALESIATQVAELRKQIEGWDKSCEQHARNTNHWKERAGQWFDKAEELRLKLAASGAKRQAAEKDAERYRCLRTNKTINVNIMTQDRVSRQIPGETLDVLLDAAIDAASKGGKP